MRSTKEILRLKLEAGLSNRKTARAVGCSCSTVSDTVTRFRATGLPWPLTEALTDSELEGRLYRRDGETATDPREPDWARVHRELSRPRVTLYLLWTEYKADHPCGYQYSWFCERYRAFSQKLDVVMRQNHKAGEKLFVDWAGDTVPIIDRATGEVARCYLFVAVLGASNYMYVEATTRQDSATFLSAHCRAFSFLGGVPECVVIDNLKTGVTRPDRYEPEINAAYADLAGHYGVTVLPARVRKPKDKALAESGVLIAYREILAPLRNRTFFSLGDLNEAISVQLRSLNERPFKKLPGSRRSLFLEIDAPALSPLPDEPFILRTRKRARIHVDYHVELEGHYYSVPFHLAREPVELVFTETSVEILHDGRRVAVHCRSHLRGAASTETSHMPDSHRRWAEWSPERIASLAKRTGPATAALCRAVMGARPHPELGYRSCLGILRLSTTEGSARLEAACERALGAGALSCKSVKSILKLGLDRTPVAPAPPPGPNHDNLRGASYYR